MEYLEVGQQLLHMHNAMHMPYFACQRARQLVYAKFWYYMHLACCFE